MLPRRAGHWPNLWGCAGAKERPRIFRREIAFRARARGDALLVPMLLQQQQRAARVYWSATEGERESRDQRGSISPGVPVLVLSLSLSVPRSLYTGLLPRGEIAGSLVPRPALPRVLHAATKTAVRRVWWRPMLLLAFPARGSFDSAGF